MSTRRVLSDPHSQSFGCEKFAKCFETTETEQLEALTNLLIFQYFSKQEAFNQIFSEAYDERDRSWWKKLCLAAVGFGALATLVYQQSS